MRNKFLHRDKLSKLSKTVIDILMAGEGTHHK